MRVTFYHSCSEETKISCNHLCFLAVFLAWCAFRVHLVCHPAIIRNTNSQEPTPQGERARGLLGSWGPHSHTRGTRAAGVLQCRSKCTPCTRPTAQHPRQQRRPQLQLCLWSGPARLTQHVGTKHLSPQARAAQHYTQTHTRLRVHVAAATPVSITVSIAVHTWRFMLPMCPLLSAQGLLAKSLGPPPRVLAAE